MNSSNIININERKALRVSEAVSYSGLGRTTVFGLIKDKRVESVKIGRSRLVLKASLDALLTDNDRLAA